MEHMKQIVQPLSESNTHTVFEILAFGQHHCPFPTVPCMYMVINDGGLRTTIDWHIFDSALSKSLVHSSHS